MKKDSTNKKTPDRESVIESGDGGAAAIVAGLLLVALVIVGLFFFFSVTHTTSDAIVIDMPKTIVGAM